MKTKKLIYVLFLIASVLCAVGCSGTRKATTQTDKVDLKTDTEVQTKEVESTKVEINTNVTETKKTTIDKENNVVKEVIEIVPIDATKESVFTDAKGQKFNLNNSKYRNEKTTDLSKEKSVSLSEYKLIQKDLKQALKINEELIKEVKELQQKLKAKEVVSEKGNFWNWVILIILILAFAYWFYWSRKIVKDKENLEL